MQKRLKKALLAQPQSVVAAQPLSVSEKLEKLRTEMPSASYIRQAGLIPGILPISQATLWRWVSKGEFPKPVKLSSRVTAWRVADVSKWLMEKKSESCKN